MSRRAGRWAAFVLLPVSLGVALIALMAPSPAQPAASALDIPAQPAAVVAHGEHTATATTAAVVVQLDAGRHLVRLVDFAQPISGLQALVQSGLDATVADAGFGPAICAIAGVGCPADDCFCDPDLFWNYSFWDGSAWQSYSVGAAESIISTPGAIEGWRWGAFEEAQASPDAAIAAASALEWLGSQQDPATGGFGGGAGSAVEVLLALGANDETAASWRTAAESPSLRDFLRTRATRYSRENVAAAGKLAVANAAASGCRTVRSQTPRAYLTADTPVYAPDSGFNAWGILGAAALSETVPAAAVDALLGQQQPDGGWEWQAGFGSDTNTTAVAVQALVAAGQPVDSSAVFSGLAFLKSGQTEDGGIVYDPSKPEQGADANSTAYAIQAIAAAGQDPTGGEWTVGDHTPVSFLLSLQLPDGSFEWQPGRGADLLATAQAVPALLRAPYPVVTRQMPSCAAQDREAGGN